MKKIFVDTWGHVVKIIEKIRKAFSLTEEEFYGLDN